MFFCFFFLICFSLLKSWFLAWTKNAYHTCPSWKKVNSFPTKTWHWNMNRFCIEFSAKMLPLPNYGLEVNGWKKKVSKQQDLSCKACKKFISFFFNNIIYDLVHAASSYDVYKWTTTFFSIFSLVFHNKKRIKVDLH